MDRDAIEKGRAYEPHIAKQIGAELVPGSGNQWFAKLDIGARKFLWSLKHTKKRSFGLSRALMGEAKAAVHGPGGHGADYTTGMIVHVDGLDLVVMELGDFIELVRDDVKLVPVTKSEQKRSRANESLLSRKLTSRE